MRLNGSQLLIKMAAVKLKGNKVKQSPTSACSGEGEYQEWERIWGSLSEDAIQLYTPRKPRTLPQFWQRCYFEDLSGLIARNLTGGRFLELGSGRGTTSMYLAASGHDVTMVDLSDQAFCVAEENFARVGIPKPAFIKADARHTGLPPQTYDCIHNIGLLEHFDDPRPVLAEALRLLRPGGYMFMVIVPSIPTSRRWLTNMLFCPWRLLPRALKDIVKRFLRRPMPAPNAAMTRTSYTAQRYQQWSQELGAVDVVCIPYNPYHQVYSTKVLEHFIVLPLYRLHHLLKRRLVQPPYLRTWAGLSSCLLLTCRKGG